MRVVITLLLLLLARQAGHALTLRHILLSGNKTTRSSIILRELEINEGTGIADTAAFLQRCRERLANLALFTTIHASLQPVAADSADLHIAVKERWYIIPRPVFQLADRNFNVWWAEQHRDLRRINGGLTITDKNFRGNLESVSLTAQAGYTQRLGIDYAIPYLDRQQRQGIGVSLSGARSGEVAYATNNNKLQFARLPGTHIFRQLDAALYYTYRPRFAVRHTIALEYHRLNVSDTILELNNKYLSEGADQLQYAAISYRTDLNFTDNWNYPLRGFKMVNYLVAKQGLDNAFCQVQLRTEAGLFQAPFRKWYFAEIFRGRLSVPNDVPYYFRSALGTKTEYVRGFEYYVVDGSHYGLLRLDVKREIFNKTLLALPFRYLPSVPLRIYPKVFFDAGVVHNSFPGNSFLHGRLLYSYGAGIDILSAYDLKIRIEAARNSLGQNGLFLHLNSE